jgi:hypothetical protein
MKTTYYSMGLIGFCFLFIVLCFSQESAGGRVTDAAGFSFGPPAGFIADRGPDGYSFVNPEKTILLVVRPHRYATFEAAVRDTTLERRQARKLGAKRRQSDLALSGWKCRPIPDYAPSGKQRGGSKRKPVFY